MFLIGHFFHKIFHLLILSIYLMWLFYLCVKFLLNLGFLLHNIVLDNLLISLGFEFDKFLLSFIKILFEVDELFLLKFKDLLFHKFTFINDRLLNFLYYVLKTWI